MDSRTLTMGEPEEALPGALAAGPCLVLVESPDERRIGEHGVGTLELLCAHADAPVGQGELVAAVAYMYENDCEAATACRKMRLRNNHGEAGA